MARPAERAAAARAPVEALNHAAAPSPSSNDNLERMAKQNEKIFEALSYIAEKASVAEMRQCQSST
eukprot:7077331-Pyramimonas_sp.AAC.1